MRTQLLITLFALLVPTVAGCGGSISYTSPTTEANSPLPRSTPSTSLAQPQPSKPATSPSTTSGPTTSKPSSTVVGHVHGFTSPSGNINCGVFLESNADFSGFVVPHWGKTKRMGCVIAEHTYGPHQKDCDADATYYLNSMTRTGKVTKLGCSGDSANVLYGLALPGGVHALQIRKYGQTVDLDAARCRVERHYVRCVNRSGHGWVLSRSTNRAF